MSETASTLWAITTFFNPARYKQRLRNYRLFRKALGVPLVAVELSHDGRFELTDRDADILVSVSSPAVMWHKERLLNIALKHLPREVEYVAWLDCDVRFCSGDWSRLATEALQTFKLVQLFKRLYDLPRGVCAIAKRTRQEATGVSIASQVSEDRCALDMQFRPNTNTSVRRGAFGLAWAARRRDIQRHGFYDAMVIGSGDRAMACAALGRFDDAIYTARLDRVRAAHYLDWARPFSANMYGSVSHLDIDICHLWHGDLKDRQYIDRHKAFAELDFDPRADLARNQDDCLVWTERGRRLEPFMLQYFASRREDGT